MKVDFLICGTQKGGTTALDAYLRTHNEICLANTKEVHFFDNDENFQSINIDYSRYHHFFSVKLHHKTIGEITPIYMYWKNCPQRIWEYNKRMKIILLLRNPIERAYSHWNMEVSRGNESLSFIEAIKQEKSRLTTTPNKQHRIYSYIDRGFYSCQIKRIWEFFSKDQVLILKSESLKKEPKQALEKITNFLSVSPFEEITPLIAHEGKYDGDINENEKEILKSIYQHEIHELEQMLKWNCSNWLTA